MQAPRYAAWRAEKREVNLAGHETADRRKSFYNRKRTGEHISARPGHRKGPEPLSPNWRFSRGMSARHNIGCRCFVDSGEDLLFNFLYLEHPVSPPFPLGSGGCERGEKLELRQCPGRFRTYGRELLAVFTRSVLRVKRVDYFF